MKHFCVDARTEVESDFMKRTGLLEVFLECPGAATDTGKVGHPIDNIREECQDNFAREGRAYSLSLTPQKVNLWNRW